MGPKLVENPCSITPAEQWNAVIPSDDSFWIGSWLLTVWNIYTKLQRSKRQELLLLNTHRVYFWLLKKGTTILHMFWHVICRLLVPPACYQHKQGVRRLHITSHWLSASIKSKLERAWRQNAGVTNYYLLLVLQSYRLLKVTLGATCKASCPKN